MSVQSRGREVQGDCLRIIFKQVFGFGLGMKRKESRDKRDGL